MSSSNAGTKTDVVGKRLKISWIALIHLFLELEIILPLRCLVSTKVIFPNRSINGRSELLVKLIQQLTQKTKPTERLQERAHEIKPKTSLC